MRVKRSELTGVKVEDLVEFYIGSRAAGTLSMYSLAFKKV